LDKNKTVRVQSLLKKPVQKLLLNRSIHVWSSFTLIIYGPA